MRPTPKNSLSNLKLAKYFFCAAILTWLFSMGLIASELSPKSPDHPYPNIGPGNQQPVEDPKDHGKADQSFSSKLHPLEIIGDVIIEKTKPIFTFTTCPQAFPHSGQTLGLLTWLRLDPQPEVIYISDDPGVKEETEKFGIRHVGQIKVNSFGTPLLDDIFEKAQEYATGEIIVYMNPDIIVTQSFMDVLMFMYQSAKHLDSFLLVGPRTDINLPSRYYKFDQAWYMDFDKEFNKGLWSGDTAIDYFIFKKAWYMDFDKEFNKGLWSGDTAILRNTRAFFRKTKRETEEKKEKILILWEGLFPKGSFPPFAIGRFAWDTWILSHILHGPYPTINGNKLMQAYHINHHYNIKGLPQDGLNNSPIEKKMGSPEFRENMRLVDENGGSNGGELDCCEYAIDRCGPLKFRTFY